MAIYFKDKEITNIDNLVPQIGLDITDIWFGDTNVYTVWQVYEGTLPTTLNANGDAMRQYQIYGNTGGVGDRTAQLFDKTATDTDNGYIARAYLKSDGTVASDDSINVSEYIPVSGNTVYILRYIKESVYCNVPSVCFYDISKNFISGSAYSNKNPKSFTTPAAAAYVRLSFRRIDVNIVVLAKDSTIPEPLPPYGYEVDMATGSNILQNSEIEQGGWQASAGSTPEKIVYSQRCRSKNIYAISSKKIFYDYKSLNVNVAFIDIDGLSLGGTGFKSGVGSVDVPANAVKCLFIIGNTNTDNGITTAQVIAAGIWASVDATTTPIYIGSGSLNKDEYVDYQEGKVFRRTENLFDKDVALDGYEIINYGFNRNANWCVSDFIPVEGNTLYKSVNSGGAVLSYTDKSSQPTRLSGALNTNGVMTLSETKFIKMNCQISQKASCIVAKSNDLPETYIPYLQPTDPPVPLPALPTCEGTTIVGYAGQSVAIPEKVAFKYRKKNF